jgi:aspartate aminotransferase
VLRQHPSLFILSDDIYEYLVYDGTLFYTLATVAPDLQERILIVNGVSKSCSMTGWRIGYGVGPGPLIKAMAMLQSQSTSNACSIAQAAAIAAINGPHDFLPAWCATFTKRRDLCLEALNKIPGLSCAKPVGAFYLYIGCQGIIGKTTPQNKTLHTDDDFCNYLLEDAHVALVSGSGFGLSPYVRLSYAASEETLAQGCQRISEAVKKLR